VHHAYNPPGRDQAIKKWKEFLLDEKYNFNGSSALPNRYSIGKCAS